MNRDRDIQVLILEAPRTMTFSDLEEAVRVRFGDECGWSRSRIVAFWNERMPVKSGVRPRLDDDVELRRFVDDRLTRLTLDDVRAAAITVFGVDRVPSRSALHRHWQRVRGVKR